MITACSIINVLWNKSKWVKSLCKCTWVTGNNPFYSFFFLNGLILSSSAIAFLFEHFSSYLYSYNDNFPTLWVKNFSGCHRLGVVFLVWCSNGSALMKASLGTLCSLLCHQGFFLSNVLSCDAWQEELPFNQCDNE